jgi:hypothetical protein
VDESVAIERRQQQEWFASVCGLLQRHLAGLPPRVNGEASIVAKSREVVGRHEFAFAGGAAHACRIVVAGPPRSGRST